MNKRDRASQSSSQQEDEDDEEGESDEESGVDESSDSDSEESPSPDKRKQTKPAAKEGKQATGNGESIFAGVEDDEFFTEHAKNQKFLALKQASKLDYYRKENEQLKEQIRNLTTNLRLNKQLLAMTESHNSQSIINVDRTELSPTSTTNKQDKSTFSAANLAI